MIKNVWELQPDEIVVFEYEQYPKHRFKWNKDIKQYRPGIGKTLIRELVCIDDPTITQRFIRGIDVIVVE